ncbi:hypothetical protein Bhyg_07837, partial [Pseudolycoriella hygida]
HSRTEYNGQVYDENLTANFLSTDLLEPRYHEGANSDSLLNINSGGHYSAGPNSESSYRNHHVYEHPELLFGSRRGDYAAGPSCESNNPNHHGYGYPQLPFGSRRGDYAAEPS